MKNFGVEEEEKRGNGLRDMKIPLQGALNDDDARRGCEGKRRGDLL